MCGPGAQCALRPTTLCRTWLFRTLPGPAMAEENDFQPRPGRIRSSRSQRAKPFIAQALAAAQRAGGGVSRQGLLTERQPLDLRPRPCRQRAGEPSADRPLAPGDGQDPRRPPRGPLGAARRPSRLSPARGRHPGRGEGAAVRPGDRGRRSQGLRRAVRGRPPSFPLHRLARGRAGDGRPQGLRPRAGRPDGEGSRHQARLGRRRSLEHRSIRTSTSSCAASPTTARTSSSPATTSRRACAPAPRTWSRRNWGCAAISTSAARSSARSTPSAGPSSTGSSPATPIGTASSTSRRMPDGSPIHSMR